VDADGVAACATGAEERAARRAGFRTVRVGLGARRGVPAGSLVSFGVAGGLDGLEIGDLIDATRIVDEQGRVLWEGEGLGVAGARRGTILAADRVVDDPAERRRLHELTGADAVDMESGVLARSGRLVGVLRVVSDSVESAVEGVDTTVHADGSTDVVGLLRWVATRRGDAIRSMKDAVAALRALERSVA
jgi:adenosylhomocysteine nucleosidase